MRFHMNSYEREYFVSRIRSGFYNVKLDSLKVRIYTPTFEDEYFANEVFMESFDESRSEGIQTQEEMLDWMYSKDLWSDEQEEKIKGINKDIEKLKVEIFQSRSKEKLRETIRAYIRTAEKALQKIQSEKDEYFNRTCEGMALQDKAMFLFGRCCFVGKERLDISDIDLGWLYYEYNNLMMSEKQLRELARNDPWRLIWHSKDHHKLFNNSEDRVLSNDQKGILIWSGMYDNIQESMDCPTEDVINDDDLLDGWFIVQRRKQESEKAKAELEARTSNSKIANSDEILIVTDSRREAENIHNMNSIGGDIVRKQRIEQAKNLGKATDMDFADRKLDAMNQQRQMFKDKVRR